MTYDTDCAYAAGFVDGEGSIAVWRESRPKNNSGYRYRAAVEVSNTDVEIIQWFKENFGGHICQTNRKNVVNKKHKPLYRWICKTSEVGEFLDKILPYLQVKQKQAEVVQQYLAWKRRSDQRPGKRQIDVHKHNYFWLLSKSFNARV